MSYLLSYMPISYVDIKRGSLCKFWINMYMTIQVNNMRNMENCMQMMFSESDTALHFKWIEFIIVCLNLKSLNPQKVCKSIPLGIFLHLQALWKKCFINFWCRVYLFAYLLIFKSTVKRSQINVSSSRFHSTITQDLLSSFKSVSRHVRTDRSCGIQEM